MNGFSKRMLLSVLTLAFSTNAGIFANLEPNPSITVESEIKPKLESLDINKIRKITQIPYEKLPQAVRLKIDLAFSRLSVGDNVKAMSNFSKTALKRAAEQKGYEFVTVDLDSWNSTHQSSLSKSNLNIVYLDSFRCDDVYNYRELAERLENTRYGIFINKIPTCKNPKCNNCHIRDSILRDFTNYPVLADSYGYDSSNEDYDSMVKYILKNCQNELGMFKDFTDEQISAVCDFMGSWCRNYKDIEECFSQVLINISQKKEYDFDSLFCNLINLNKNRYNTVSMNFPDTLLKNVSIHEVCHAFMMKRFGISMPSVHVFSDSSGVCWPHPGKNIDHMFTKTDFENYIMIYLAGRAGEEVFLGAPSHGGDHDLYVAAYPYARTALSLDDINFPNLDEKAQTQACTDYLNILYSDVKAILSENKELILKLSDEIMKREEKYAQRYMLGSEFNRLFDKFDKEISNVKKFQEDNYENLKNIAARLAADQELWNNIKSMFGIKSEDSDNKKQENSDEKQKKEIKEDTKPSVGLANPENSNNSQTESNENEKNETSSEKVDDTRQAETAQ